MLWFQTATSRFPPKTGARTPSRRILKDERKTNRQGCDTSSANEGLAHASPVPVACEWLSHVEMSQELSFLGTGASFARPKGRSARVRRLFVRAGMDSPEVLAVVPLPSAADPGWCWSRLTSFLAGDHTGCYGERILLPDGLRVKLTNSCWRNAHENGDDTGDSVFCNGSRFSRRGAVANAGAMHVLGWNQHCF